jgi:hypothetical protein
MKTPLEMLRYELAQMHQWRHKVSGATASPFGACPWTNDADRPNWTYEACGYGYIDTREGTRHGQHGTSREVAAARVDRMNAEYAARCKRISADLDARIARAKS